MLKETRTENKYYKKMEKVIDYLQSRGYEHIKADLPEFETPSKLVRQNDDQVFIPDVTAKRNGRKSYFEIAKKTSQKRDLAGKWKLLSFLAEMKNGIFKVFVPHGHMRFTRDLVQEYQIEVEIIKI